MLCVFVLCVYCFGGEFVMVWEGSLGILVIDIVVVFG